MKESKWKCEVCNTFFKSKHDLYKHKKAESHYLVNNSKLGIVKSDINLIYKCKYCGREILSKSGCTLHEKSCDLNPNKVPGSNLGYHHSEEVRKKLSEIRKKKIKENGGVWWNSRSNCKRSYAEDWVLKIINNEVLDKDFVEEYHLNKWFMDFAWPKKKIYIEVDGQQHQWEDRKKRDEEKDEYYKSLGWKCLRLSWSYCCNNTQECIKDIIDFVDNSIVVDINWKSKKELHDERLEKAKSLGMINSIGRIDFHKISEDEFENRKNLILNSGVDISKFGWVTKVVDKTGLSKHQILDVCRHFKLKVFQRKNKDL